MTTIVVSVPSATEPVSKSTSHPVFYPDSFWGKVPSNVPNSHSTQQFHSNSALQLPYDTTKAMPSR